MPDISQFTIVRQYVGRRVVCKVLNGDIFTGTLTAVTQDLKCILENVSCRLKSDRHRKSLAKEVYLSNMYIRYFMLPGGRKVFVPPPSAVPTTEANWNKCTPIDFLNFVIIKYPSRDDLYPEQPALREILVTEEARVMHARE